MITCGKASFINQKYADEYIKKLKETSVRYKRPKRAYLCEACLNWHLTSSPEEKDDSIPDKRDKYIESLKKQVESLIKKNKNQQETIKNYYNKVVILKNKINESN